MENIDQVTASSVFKDILCCPQCGEEYRSEANGAGEPNKDYDVLNCACGSYPVVAGIPILKIGVIGAAQQRAPVVVKLIREGRNHEALLAMMLPPPPPHRALAPKWMSHFPEAIGSRASRFYAERWSIPEWRENVGEMLRKAPGNVSACDFLDCYLRGIRAGQTDYHSIYDYMAYRPGSLRSCAPLACASLIQEPSGPVLEVGCGCGHITRSLVSRAQGQRVIGMDEVFWTLFIAKTWVAPEAEYICCEADRTLPFAAEAFGVIFSVDAFMCFIDRVAGAREMRRVLQPDGLILLTGLHNARVPHPRTGYPLAWERYQGFMGDLPNRVVSDRVTLERYLDGQGLDLSRQASAEQLAQELRVSVVATRDSSVFRSHGSFADWPHAAGELHINPLYQVQSASAETISLRRQFPSEWYEFDNPECRAHLPDTIQLTHDDFANLRAGRRTPAIDELIGRWVVVGLAKNYLKADSSELNTGLGSSTERLSGVRAGMWGFLTSRFGEPVLDALSPILPIIT